MSFNRNFGGKKIKIFTLKMKVRSKLDVSVLSSDSKVWKFNCKHEKDSLKAKRQIKLGIFFKILNMIEAKL